MTDPSPRTGGRILVDQLVAQGVTQAFCVPGESYLPVLDALHGAPINLTVCRQEGGAAMMAEAQGKLTGKPGICFVTRGPGAANASAGIHIAQQDSTPMILFVGQVARGTKGRDAFQEVDYRAFFGGMAKWVFEIDDPRRIPEHVARAFTVAMSGRPGPVVLSLPEDVLAEMAETKDVSKVVVSAPAPGADVAERVASALSKAERPLVIVGGSRWSAKDTEALRAFAHAWSLPVAVSFRRQDLYACDDPHFIGDLGIGCAPYLAEHAKSADLILLIGGRLSENPSQSYKLLAIPEPEQFLIHVHPDPHELGRVYSAPIPVNATPGTFLSAMSQFAPAGPDRSELIAGLRRQWERRATPPASQWRFDPGAVMSYLNEVLPADAIVTNGAGNYATWVHRFRRFTQFGTQLAPTSGSMGYGVPAAVAASIMRPERTTVAFAGDGCFLMHGQEFATAVQHGAAPIVVLLDNGMYGTIRMHQERNYPGRVIGTDLENPDFAAYAKAFGGYGERVETTEDFQPAFERARASGKASILHCIVDPEALTIDRTLSEIRDAARR